MSPRKSVSFGSFPTQRRPTARASEAHAARRRKGNSQTELTRGELEQMAIQAARMRALKARSGA